jgi:hypothetical protein
MTIRSDILNEANTLINGDREAEYGPPSENLERICRFWNVYLVNTGNDASLNTADVAYMMALLKLARACGGKTKRDTVVDMAGYVALAGEMALDPAKS